MDKDVVKNFVSTFGEVHTTTTTYITPTTTFEVTAAMIITTTIGAGPDSTSVCPQVNELEPEQVMMILQMSSLR